MANGHVSNTRINHRHYEYYRYCRPSARHQLLMHWRTSIIVFRGPTSLPIETSHLRRWQYTCTWMVVIRVPVGRVPVTRDTHLIRVRRRHSARFRHRAESTSTSAFPVRVEFHTLDGRVKTSETSGGIDRKRGVI